MWFELPNLINIINNFTWENSEKNENDSDSEIEMVALNFSDKDYDEIINSIVALMDNYIINHPLEFSNPSFEDNIENYIISNLTITLEPINSNYEIVKNTIISCS